MTVRDVGDARDASQRVESLEAEVDELRVTLHVLLWVVGMVTLTVVGLLFTEPARAADEATLTYVSDCLGSNAPVTSTREAVDQCIGNYYAHGTDAGAARLGAVVDQPGGCHVYLSPSTLGPGFNLSRSDGQVCSAAAANAVVATDGTRVGYWIVATGTGLMFALGFVGGRMR